MLVGGGGYVDVIGCQTGYTNAPATSTVDLKVFINIGYVGPTTTFSYELYSTASTGVIDGTSATAKVATLTSGIVMDTTNLINGLATVTTVAVSGV